MRAQSFRAHVRQRYVLYACRKQLRACNQLPTVMTTLLIELSDPTNRGKR